MDEARERRAIERSRVYQFLALAFSFPRADLDAWLRDQIDALSTSLIELGDHTSADGLQAVARTLNGSDGDALKDAHRRCFGHTISKECPPYEAEYGQAHIFQKSDTLADVAGFYRAFGLEPAADAHERLDHIGIELEFMEHLCRKEAYALTKRYSDHRLTVSSNAQRKFLAEHLGNWVFDFAARLKCKDGEGLYGRLAEVLDTFIAQELAAMGLPVHAASNARQAERMQQEEPACDACPLASGGSPLENGAGI